MGCCFSQPKFTHIPPPPRPSTNDYEAASSNLTPVMQSLSPTSTPSRPKSPPPIPHCWQELQRLQQQRDAIMKHRLELAKERRHSSATRLRYDLEWNRVMEDMRGTEREVDRVLDIVDRDQRPISWFQS